MDCIVVDQHTFNEREETLCIYIFYLKLSGISLKTKIEVSCTEHCNLYIINTYSLLFIIKIINGKNGVTRDSSLFYIIFLRWLSCREVVYTPIITTFLK